MLQAQHRVTDAIGRSVPMTMKGIRSAPRAPRRFRMGDPRLVTCIMQVTWVACAMRRKSFEKMHCPIARSLERVGEWWSILILRDALHGYRRFEEFRESLGVAPNILTTPARRAGRGRLAGEAAVQRAAAALRIRADPARARFPPGAAEPDGVRQPAFRARRRDGRDRQHQDRQARRPRRVRPRDRSADRRARLRDGAGPGRERAHPQALCAPQRASAGAA